MTVKEVKSRIVIAKEYQMFALVNYYKLKIKLIRTELALKIAREEQQPIKPKRRLQSERKTT